MGLYFSGVTLFDGRTVKTKQGVLIVGDQIAWTGPHARAPREARGAHEEPAVGRTLTPGLIDCHVHLCFDGEADFAAEGRSLTPTIATLKAARNVRRHLARGVTTVRDLGGLGTVACELARSIDGGSVPGARVLAAGRALTVTGGHGHGVGFAREVDGADAVRRAVREEIRGGATAIKVVATGGVLTPGIAADFTAFTPEELAAAVDEAHAWNRGIAAHAIGEIGMARAVDAGVDSIEHGSMMSAATARAMKEAGTFHVATIGALRGIVDNPDQVPEYALTKAESIVERARDSFRRAMRAGVRHACGTDAGTPFNRHGGAPVEIVRMVEWEMTPLKAMQAATVNAAELLRLGDAGTIEPGKRADVVLYPGDPLEEIEHVLEPALVVQAGVPVAGTFAGEPVAPETVAPDLSP